MKQLEAAQSDFFKVPERQDDFAEAALRERGTPCQKKRHTAPLFRSIKLKNGPKTTTTNFGSPSNSPQLVKTNRFWRDYVNHEAGKPFLTQHVSDATGNFTEMMLAFAVLDLPFESPEA